MSEYALFAFPQPRDVVAASDEREGPSHIPVGEPTLRADIRPQTFRRIRRASLGATSLSRLSRYRRCCFHQELPMVAVRTTCSSPPSITANRKTHASSTGYDRGSMHSPILVL